MSSESLINRHRPNKFSGVIGQAAAIKSFSRALDDGTSHGFILQGPSGVGKTTLARIAAKRVKTIPLQLIEVDGATKNTVDDMRELISTLAYRPLGGMDSSQSFIVDECQRIRADGWTVLLKSVEEPPDWVYWFFCTTDAGKIPDAIKTRCMSINLKPVDKELIAEYLEQVVAAEKFKTPTEVIDLCVREAHGSPRMALTKLAACYDCKTRKEALEALSKAEESTSNLGYRLAQALFKAVSANDRRWSNINPILEEIATTGENPEGVRHVVRAYFTKVLIGAKNEEQVRAVATVLEHFTGDVFNEADGVSSVALAVARSLYSD
jgi:DNA polymerase III gamma/tau subunit